ncbi:protein of unknown function [Thauera humireducens]|nr:protein of unknown function [Thauera humireducens]
MSACSARITWVGPWVMPVAASKAGKSRCSSASKWAFSAREKAASASAAPGQSPFAASASARAKSWSHARWSWVIKSAIVLMFGSGGHEGILRGGRQAALMRVKLVANAVDGSWVIRGRRGTIRAFVPLESACRVLFRPARGYASSSRSRSAITCPTCCAR